MKLIFSMNRGKVWILLIYCYVTNHLKIGSLKQYQYLVFSQSCSVGWVRLSRNNLPLLYQGGLKAELEPSEWRLFTHRSGSWCWLLSGKSQTLGEKNSRGFWHLSLFFCGLSMWCLQQGSFSLTGLITEQLRPPKACVPRERETQWSFLS